MDEQHDIVGASHRIRFWSQGARCPVYEFISELEARDCDRVLALLKRVADHGVPLHNPERARQLKGCGNLYEFKSHAVRILFFTGQGDDLILAHAFKKRTTKTPSRAVDTALRIRDEWEQQHTG